MLLRLSQVSRPGLAFRAAFANKRQGGLPNRLILFIMAVIVTRWPLPASAGEADLPGARSSYQLKLWTTEDGLPQHEISCLKQTHDGYLWIGTHFGLSRFDGVRFTSFDEANTSAMLNESVSNGSEGNSATT